MPSDHTQQLIQTIDQAWHRKKVTIQADASSHIPSPRLIVAIAGPSGSGKSTLAQQAVAQINQRQISQKQISQKQISQRQIISIPESELDQSPIAAYIPLDGFHLPNYELDQKGIRHEKGKPHTFDLKNYLKLLQQIQTQTRDDPPIDFPIYCRKKHDPIWPQTKQTTVWPNTSIIITEGNYLLLPQAPWQTLRPQFDLAFYLDISWEICRRRLLNRHHQGGRDWSDCQNQIRQVDEPNAKLIQTSQAQADMVLN